MKKQNDTTIWDRAKIMDFARYYAKGSGGSKTLTEVSQEACRLSEEVEKFSNSVWLTEVVRTAFESISGRGYLSEEYHQSVDFDAAVTQVIVDALLEKLKRNKQ